MTNNDSIPLQQTVLSEVVATDLFDCATTAEDAAVTLGTITTVLNHIAVECSCMKDNTYPTVETGKAYLAMIWLSISQIRESISDLVEMSLKLYNLSGPMTGHDAEEDTGA